VEEFAGGTQLDNAAPILEQLETIAKELVKQIDGITVEASRRQAGGMDEHYGQPVLKPLTTGTRPSGQAIGTLPPALLGSFAICLCRVFLPSVNITAWKLSVQCPNAL
jgi:hypothetical protein